ncbi:MAG: LptF/LptG family permease [Zetaproteobacteria bacterium]|nr:MAG: LptF/LptG family permease [Zetaproteobacteria bacterium]
MPILFRWQFLTLSMRLLLVQAALLSLFVVIEAFDKSRLLGHHGMTVPVLVEYILLKAPMMVAEFMPLTLLIASVVHLLLMARHRELVALHAGGLGLAKVALPMAAVALAGMGVMVLLDEWVTPVTNVRLNYIERVHVHGREPEEGRRMHWYRDGNRFFRMAPRGDGSMRLLVIETDGAGRWRRRIDAGRARYREGVWRMRDVVISAPDAHDGVTVTRLDAMELPAGNGGPQLRRPWPNEMNSLELFRFARRLDALGLESEGYRYALHRRIAHPCSCLVMAVVALAFCGRPRSGRGVGEYRASLGALCFGLLLYISGNAVSMLAGGGRLPPAFAAWLPDLLFGGLAVFLLLQRMED